MPAPPPRPPRPLANVKPANVSHSQERRKVSFQDGPPEEIDNLYDASRPAKSTPSAGGGGKASKWQPLSTTDHSSVGENDPFSLGDSEDERDNNSKPKDGDQLKVLTAEAMESDIGSGSESKKEDNKKPENI